MSVLLQFMKFAGIQKLSVVNSDQSLTTLIIFRIYFLILWLLELIMHMCTIHNHFTRKQDNHYDNTRQRYQHERVCVIQGW